MTDPTESEIAELLHAIDALLEAHRRLVTLGQRLLARATDGPSVTDQEQTHARTELQTARQGIERIHALLLLRKQNLRRM